MYKIIGADQKEYGPVTSDQVREWLSQGRANAQTKVQPVGSTNWIALANIPEFADALGIPALLTSAGSPPPLPIAGARAAEQPAKTSGMAIASLVFGVLGFCGITALIGLILGIVSMIKIKNSQGRLTGNGLAIAGICVSGFMLLVCIPMIAITSGMMLPALARAKERAQTIQCVNNMKQLALALKIYSNDHDEKFPAASGWCDAIKNETTSERVFKCAAANSSERSGYAFNSKLSGLNQNDVPPDTVMIFEAVGGWNVSGGRELMMTRHGRRYVVALADGSVQQISASQLRDLRWSP